MIGKKLRDPVRWAAVVLSACLVTPALSQPDERAVACDTLVSLRVLTASTPDRAAALALAADRPGCKVIPRAAIGAVEHRAMIGGAPFECLAVQGEPACLWVQP